MCSCDFINAGIANYGMRNHIHLSRNISEEEPRPALWQFRVFVAVGPLASVLY
jgi:hypothetical protein